MIAKDRLRIITYHRVVDFADCHPYFPRVISATPEEFERQMRWIAERYPVIDSSAVVSAIQGEGGLPSRAVVLTFDDGYPDFKTTIWPVLKTLGLPATLFVPTAYASEPHVPFWWDRLYACVMTSRLDRFYDESTGEHVLADDQERTIVASHLLNFVKSQPHSLAMAWLDRVCQRLCPEETELRSTLSWHEIRELAADGVTIGAHSRTHPLLTRVSERDARNEIEGSLLDLRRELGDVLPIFCYPSGASDSSIQTIAAQCGVVLGFGTASGHNKLSSCNRLDLRRINVTRRTTLPVLRVKLSSAGIVLDRLRRKLRR